jgi:hypothetical protein
VHERRPPLRRHPTLLQLRQSVVERVRNRTRADLRAREQALAEAPATSGPPTSCISLARISRRTAAAWHAARAPHGRDHATYARGERGGGEVMRSSGCVRSPLAVSHDSGQNPFASVSSSSCTPRQVRCITVAAASTAERFPSAIHAIASTSAWAWCSRGSVASRVTFAVNAASRASWVTLDDAATGGWSTAVAVGVDEKTT